MVSMLHVLIREGKKNPLFTVFLSKLGATKVSAVTSSKLVKSGTFAFGEKDD